MSLWYEENANIPAYKRVNWFGMYKYADVLEEYMSMRNWGFNPACDLKAFSKWLS